MTKKAVIFTMWADNEITNDLGWDGFEVYVAWDPVADEWLFADMVEAKVKEWLDIRNYVEAPISEFFTSKGGSWEVIE
jgi:hypothetical protein